MQNNVSLLVLFFFLPGDMLKRCPRSLSLPQSPWEAFHTDHYAALVGSSAFKQFVRESYAREAWQSFSFTGSRGNPRKIPGKYDDYADSFMLKQLALQICEYMVEKLEQTEYSSQSLSAMAEGESIDRPSITRFRDEVVRMTASIIAEQNWQSLIDLACESLTPDDYSSQYSNARIDAERRWRHERVKGGAPLSLDALREQRDVGFDITDSSYDPSSLLDEIEPGYDLLSGVTDGEAAGEADEADIYHGEEIDGDYKAWEARKIAELHAEFSVYNDILHSPLGHTLSEKDREMLRLRRHDVPVADIAKVLGYKTHSAVVKRLNKLVGQFNGEIPIPAKQQTAMDQWITENDIVENDADE